MATNNISMKNQMVNCIYCDVEETVEQFLLKCKGSKNEYVNYHNECEMDYDIVRNTFKCNLIKYKKRILMH